MVCDVICISIEEQPAIGAIRALGLIPSSQHYTTEELTILCFLLLLIRRLCDACDRYRTRVISGCLYIDLFFSRRE